MSFSIDHTAFMLQAADLWVFINTGGFVAAITTLVCGFFTFKILSTMFSDDEDS